MVSCTWPIYEQLTARDERGEVVAVVSIDHVCGGEVVSGTCRRCGRSDTIQINIVKVNPPA